MSETVRHIGKIRKVNLNGLTVEEWYKKKCEERGITLQRWHDGYKQAFLDEEDDVEFVSSDNSVWEIVEDKEEEDTEELSVLTPNSDGTYSYIMQFYNGGTYLGEMLGEAIRTIEGIKP